MFKLMAVATKFVADESGAAFVEYVLLVALIAVVAIVSVTSFGSHVSSMFKMISTKVDV